MATQVMDEPLRIPSEAIFTDDDSAKKSIENIRPDSVTPLVIRKNEPVIRVVLPNVFVESVSLPTNRNVNKFRVSVKRPTDDVLKPVQNGKVTRFVIYLNALYTCIIIMKYTRMYRISLSAYSVVPLLYCICLD